MPCPWYRPEEGLKFLEAHGLAVRAVGGSFQPYLLQGLPYLCHIVEPIVEPSMPACPSSAESIKCKALIRVRPLYGPVWSTHRWTHKGVLH